MQPNAADQPVDPAEDGFSRLDAHGFSLAVAPREGATVAALSWRAPSGLSVPLLYAPRGARPGRAAPNRFGLWPMLPFANRAFGAVVDDGQQRVSLPVNDPETRSTIHGFGWQSAWTVTQERADRLMMAHERQAGADPYAYEASLAITLVPGQIRFDLAITSRAPRPLPFGIGLHPWFPCAADTVLTCAARSVLVLGPGYRATGEVPFEDGGPFARGARVHRDAELALSLIDWSGLARLETPSMRLSIGIAASDSLRHPVLWTPPRAGFVCLEPQSHALGAPSEPAARAATPLRRLEPGETLSGWMTLSPAELAG